MNSERQWTADEMNRLLRCEEYQLDKLKDLMNNLKQATILDVLNSGVPVVDKVLAAEKLGFVPPEDLRVLALKSCENAFTGLKQELTQEEQQLISTVLEAARLYLNSVLSLEELRQIRQPLFDYVQGFDHSNYAEVKRRLGLMEMVLATTKGRSDGAYRDVNSIQREIQGVEIAEQQLEEIFRLLQVHIPADQ